MRGSKIPTPLLAPGSPESVDAPRPRRDLPNMPSTEPILEACALSKVYDMGAVKVEALRSVDLVLTPGELVVMLGASGSGKSTLVNILGGLDRATSGQLLFEGADLSTADDAALTLYRRRHVGFVFQLYNLVPSLTAEENVSLVSEIAEHPMDPADALLMVGLADRRHHFPAQLSGGEQQRVAIARAVVKQPKLLLCDEPTGALDAETGKLVLEVLDAVNRDTGATTLIITHNVAIAAMADRVIHMSSGEITEIIRNEHRAPIQGISW